MSNSQQEIEASASLVLTEASRILEAETQDTDPWKKALEQVRDVARRVASKAREPVKLGIVGEFSAGKTLLLGALIGYADGLPISEDATTGNVTAVNMYSVPEMATTRFENFKVHFLTRGEFESCLEFMLADVGIRAEKAELPANLRTVLTGIKVNDPTAPGRVEDWGLDAWERTTNPALRFALRELIGFVRAFAQCGPGLCAVDADEPNVFKVDPDVVRRGLELPKNLKSIQDLTSAELPRPAVGAPYKPTELTSDLLQAAFSLVRLISVDAYVSQSVWDYANENRFTLLDFPGLGADSSGVRDLFLCLRELSEIQTVLVALNSKQPGGDEGTKIYNRLQEYRKNQDIRDMILVAASRFDELPIQDEMLKLQSIANVAKSAHVKGQELLGDDEEEVPAASAPVVGATDLLKEFPILGTCLAGAESLLPSGRSERVVLV